MVHRPGPCAVRIALHIEPPFRAHLTLLSHPPAFRPLNGRAIQSTNRDERNSSTSKPNCHWLPEPVANPLSCTTTGHTRAHATQVHLPPTALVMGHQGSRLHEHRLVPFSELCAGQIHPDRPYTAPSAR